MKKIIILALSLLIAGTAFAAAPTGPLEVDSIKQSSIQGFAPDGRYSALLTVNSVWYDMTKHAAYSATAPADCKRRLAATQSKTGTIQEPVFGGQWNTVVTSKGTPWVNYSGCTSGNLSRSTPRP